ADEYSTPNTRGTVALAKGGVPDSATNQWFINLTDNSEGLGPDNPSGGFAVFARVREADMAVVDAIAGLPVLDLYSPALVDRSWFSSLDAFTNVPMLRNDFPDGLNLADFVLVNRVYIPGNEVNPCLPVKPKTTTEFVNRNNILIPIRLNGQIYEVSFRQDFPLSDYLFMPELWRVRLLADVGQETADFSLEDGILTIPSILVDGTVFYNVRLKVIDPATLEVQLDSFDTEPPAP
ncbi:MAG: peptidylprolyl isomerase, partial [Pseudomonadales bacterium]|nr:peptidylprolyl isomerase [Pseudomonadales bacterium]